MFEAMQEIQVYVMISGTTTLITNLIQPQKENFRKARKGLLAETSFSKTDEQKLLNMTQQQKIKSIFTKTRKQKFNSLLSKSRWALN
jgi:hypothetical protein